MGTIIRHRLQLPGKKVIKDISFFIKFETSLSVTNKGEMIGAFLSLTKGLINHQF